MQLVCGWNVDGAGMFGCDEQKGIDREVFPSQVERKEGGRGSPLGSDLRNKELKGCRKGGAARGWLSGRGRPGGVEGLVPPGRA